MLITNAVVNKLQEVFAPYVNKKIKKKLLKGKDCGEIEKQAHALEQYDVIFYFLLLLLFPFRFFFFLLM